MEPTPENSPSKIINNGINPLHEMFRIVGDQMSEKDVRVLKYIYSGVTSPKLLSLVKNGYSFLLCLEKLGRVTETNFKNILDLLRIITRHDLSQFVTLQRRNPVSSDTVNEYLENNFKFDTKDAGVVSQGLSLPGVCSKSPSVNTSEIENDTDYVSSAITGKRKIKSSERKLKKKPKLELDAITTTTSCNQFEPQPSCSQNKQLIQNEAVIKEKVTCDIRLRVRAEYCHHENALDGNIVSNKPDLLDRQFEKFTRANTILKSRDLGSIVCDIKFSELTYLDAFWRDYINGSLLEALKGVFITESLKQAVGNEAIKLLVNVDEDDYEAGRIKLLQNLKV